MCAIQAYFLTNLYDRAFDRPTRNLEDHPYRFSAPSFDTCIFSIHNLTWRHVLVTKKSMILELSL
jgi:hypothetical protein